MWDESTNIFLDIFKDSIQRINPSMDNAEIDKLYYDVSLSLENEDLGRAFYEKLTNTSERRLIDFENFENNTFNVVTELTYKTDDEEFRPDIILLINGMPLVFIEVKKPNNRDGIIAEHKRIQTRFKNKKFRKFINLTQLMVFSNNMEYDDETTEPVEGAFYATASYGKPPFNYFREEHQFDLANLLSPLNRETEIEVLKDNNLLSIKDSKEFLINKEPNTPTHRICTSLFQKVRLAFLLKYSIAYVKETKGLEKHIMRYPQIFATMAIEKKLDEGIKKGIIWHTQGSGKTALAYYNVKFLTDYYQNKGVVPKFYFIVDRIDLLIQASKEFKARGLIVHKINSRDEFAKDIKATTALHNHSGKPEITVVNIQKFQDDPNVIQNTDYKLNIQRIFFLDEVHRSYNPEGSFLANLMLADKTAVRIGLTGTPLILSEKDKVKIANSKDDKKKALYDSKALFGDYIHKYYYNASIKDGYTLRLIREEIETSYKMIMKKTLEDIEVLEGNADKKIVYAHRKFVEPMLDYIVSDFERARITLNDNSIGGMVVCDSSEQAKMMYEIFQEKFEKKGSRTINVAAERETDYFITKKNTERVETAALILHDIGTKEERKELVEHFKDGKIDFLFVYNMLLTGFDAKRLKKLYIGRVIKAHNLLQTLTRVNRTYKDFKYGYVVDFADIEKEFDKTNREYFNELQSEMGDEIEHYSNLFKSAEEIESEIQEIKDVLFQYDIENAEVFSKQISEINDRSEMLKIAKALNNAKALYNIIRLSGNVEMLEKLDFRQLTVLSRDANNRLALINTKEKLEQNYESANLLNVALEDVIFAFTKVKEEEMVLADKLKDILQRTREALGGNFDQKDPRFITLKEELERLFKKKNLTEVTKEDMENNIEALEEIYTKTRELERKNQLLRAKYQNDEKYARLHKRLMEKDPLTDSETKLFEALNSLKQKVDEQIQQKSKVLENESFVEKMILRLVVQEMKNKHSLELDAETSKRINAMVVKEYMNEFHGRIA